MGLRVPSALTSFFNPLMTSVSHLYDCSRHSTPRADPCNKTQSCHGNQIPLQYSLNKSILFSNFWHPADDSTTMIQLHLGCTILNSGNRVRLKVDQCPHNITSNIVPNFLCQEQNVSSIANSLAFHGISFLPFPLLDKAIHRCTPTRFA